MLSGWYMGVHYKINLYAFKFIVLLEKKKKNLQHLLAFQIKREF